MRRAIATIMVLVALAANAAQPQLNCARGPAERSFGGSQWLVYACDDDHSVVVVSAPGSVAMPFHTGTEPSMVAPSKNVTVPVGVPTPLP